MTRLWIISINYFWLFLARYCFSISHLVSCYSSGCICSLNKCSSSISANLTSSSEGDLHSTSQKSQMLKKKEECNKYCYSWYNEGCFGHWELCTGTLLFGDNSSKALKSEFRMPKCWYSVNFTPDISSTSLTLSLLRETNIQFLAIQ